MVTVLDAPFFVDFLDYGRNKCETQNRMLGHELLRSICPETALKVTYLDP